MAIIDRVPVWWSRINVARAGEGVASMHRVIAKA
jgi:hypothetical protein